MGLIFLFVDGIGLAQESDHNPFSRQTWKGLQLLSGGQSWTVSSDSITEEKRLFKQIDARLDIGGLPQSGTGQASLFSGINASMIIGKHFGPFPHTGIKHLLADHSLFSRVIDFGMKPFFINAFPQVFFDRSKARNRWSCCTLMAREAGQRLNSEEEVRNGRAITAEILQDYWKKHLSIHIPEITYTDAAHRIKNAVIEYDLVLMEYYLTDKAGHEQEMNSAISALERIDFLLQELLPILDDGDTLILTSDHGNLEDLSVKTHTMNPVPLAVFGNRAASFSNARSLTDITPIILDCLRSQNNGNFK